MPALPFPLSSDPGAIPGEGTGRLVNAYAVRDVSGTPRWYPAPGLVPVAAPGRAAPRGGLLVGGTLYLGREDGLYALSSGFALSRVGDLSGARPITLARNNRGTDAGGPDIVIVTEIGPFVLSGGRILDYPDSDVGSPNDVAFLDGYLVFSYPSGVIRATDLNTTAINDQSYTVADAKPDGLLRVTASGGQAYAWGSASIEVLDDAGLKPFAFVRSQVIPVGLLGPWAVAGFEDGWGGPQVFAASDGTVRVLDGYTPRVVSTRAVERAIAAVAGPTLLRACVYTHGGNAIWSLSMPGATWELNVGNGQWHERRSQGLDRWRGETAVRAFGAWLIGDTVTGDVVRLDADARTERGAPVVMRVESAALIGFPAGVRVGDLCLDITTGQGDVRGPAPTATAPVCRVSWTLDGGARWRGPLARPIGPVGCYGTRVRVGDLGRTTRSGLRVAVEVSDPVAVSFAGADVGLASARNAA